MRWRSGWLAACSCVLALAACGGTSGPRLPQAYAQTLSSRADRAAELLDRGRTCRAALLVATIRDEAIAAINAHTIPAPLQEDLLSRSNDLADAVRCGSPLSGSPSPAARARALAAWARDHS
jgi:hypothetical protein